VKKIFIFCFGLLVCFGCARQEVRPPGSYKVYGQVYRPLKRVPSGYVETGIASWYGPKFHAKKTASGEIYNMYAYTAAHRILPFQTRVLVTNLENGRQVTVRINDRGPFVKNRIIDLSYQAAKAIGMLGKGTARVRLEVLGSSNQLWAKINSGKFYIQVGSFKYKDNALRLKKRLSGLGYRCRVVGYTLGLDTFWRVQVGPYFGLNQAKRIQDRLARTYQGSFIFSD